MFCRTQFKWPVPTEIEADRQLVFDKNLQVLCLVPRARAQDWLLTLLGKYQLHYQAHPDSVLHPEHMCPALAPLPRWVYSLLRGPLLSSNTPLSSHRLSADLRTWMYTLYRSLPVADLALVLYPSLSAYRDPHSRTVTDLPLS